MRKRILACLCLLMLAAALLAGCDLAGSEKPDSTPIPTMPPSATVPPEEPDGDTDDAPDGDVDDEPDGDVDDAPDGGADIAPKGIANLDIASGDDSEAVPGTNAPVLINLNAGGVSLPFTTGNAGAEATPIIAKTVITPQPEETPIGPIDPIDKPTPEPLDVAYAPYKSEPMGVSFDRPAGWREDAPADSNVQFIEPEASARDGYRTMLTVRVLSMGSKQDKNDAKVKLQELLDELEKHDAWTQFKPTDMAEASMAKANGYYAYYTAFFGENKLRGRMMVVARNNALYMVRITCPAAHYQQYEDVFRKVRATWKFL